IGSRRKNGELVASEARSEVGATARFAQTPRDLAQCGITGFVPASVVDVFELVDIDEQQTERRFVAFGAANFLTQALVEEAAVRQLGERVGGREGFERVFLAAQVKAQHDEDQESRSGDIEVSGPVSGDLAVHPSQGWPQAGDGGAQDQETSWRAKGQQRAHRGVDGAMRKCAKEHGHSNMELTRIISNMRTFAGVPP